MLLSLMPRPKQRICGVTFRPSSGVFSSHPRMRWQKYALNAEQQDHPQDHQQPVVNFKKFASDLSSRSSCFHDWTLFQHMRMTYLHVGPDRLARDMISQRAQSLGSSHSVKNLKCLYNEYGWISAKHAAAISTSGPMIYSSLNAYMLTSRQAATAPPSSRLQIKCIRVP